MGKRNAPPTYFNDRLRWYRDQHGYTLNDVEDRVRHALFGPQAHTMYARRELRGFGAEKIRRAEAGEIPESSIDVVLLIALADVYQVPLQDLATSPEVVERAARVARMAVAHLPVEMASKVRSQRAA